MGFTQKEWIIIGSLGVFLVVTSIVGITLGVVVGRQQTSQQKARNILEQNPLIDG
jgi:glucose-6-phosphate-specific signal transduction histidine kinase